MGVPGTFGQLLILFLFVLPGSVYQTVRTRLRGPIPSDQDATTKVLRALAVSTGLDAAYMALFGSALLRPLSAHSLTDLEKTMSVREIGLWSLAFLFAVPACLAALNYGVPRYWASRDWRWRVRASVWFRANLPWARPAYHPAPRTWDYAFTDIGPCYVRVKSTDGEWSGGWLGENSLASSYPEPLEVFVEQPWRMGKKGEFKERLQGSSGIYIRCEDARVVEFFDGNNLPRPELAGTQDATEEEGA